MQPFKPYFEGREEPPSAAADLRAADASAPSTSRSSGTTKRHLTFFEMLGNFSVGDYFKAESMRFGWELSTEGFGFDPERIWVTVFEGDEELGLGPDDEAIEIWREIGVPEERIVRLPALGELLAGGADRARAARARRCTSTAARSSAPTTCAPATTPTATSSTGTTSS